MSRRTLLILGVIILAAAGGYLAYTNLNSAGQTQAPQTATVTRGSLIATVSGAGPVSAGDQVMLTFGQAGTVKQVYVQMGDKVKRGQVLAELDATDLQLSLAGAVAAVNQQQAAYDKTKAGAALADVAAARAAVDSAQAAYDAAVRKAGVDDAQLAVARAGVDSAAVALQKAQSDYNQAVSDGLLDLTAVRVALQQAQIDYTSAQATYNIQVANIDDTEVRSAASTLASAKANLVTLQTTPTQPDLQIAQAALDQAKLALQQAQYNLRNVQVVAPFDGIVTQVGVDNFDPVGTTTQAVQISDLNTLQITVSMAEVDVGKLKVGQAVDITFDALADSPALTGTVAQIALVGVTQQGVVNYPVVIALNHPDPALVLTGMTANTSIIVDQRENVLLVPNRAIRTQGRNRVAQVLTAQGATTVTVTIGLQNDSYSEVQSGLKEGDVVVIISGVVSRPATGGGFSLPGLGGFGR